MTAASALCCLIVLRSGCALLVVGVVHTCFCETVLFVLQETSGLADSIDYFISFDDIEAPLGVAQYSEQLVRLHGFHSQFSHPMHLASPGHKENTAASADAQQYSRFASHTDATDAHIQGKLATSGRSAAELLGSSVSATCLLPKAQHNSTCTNQPLYLCPQTLYKLHPVFDDVIVDLLLRDPCGRVLFLHGSSEAWDMIVLKRIADALALRY